MRDLADELLQAKVKARLFGGDRAPRLGRLVLLDRVGAGAMGTVYTAYDPRLDRKVAVKVLHAATTAEVSARFLREARSLAKLAHPNVVTIHDAGELDGAAYLVMELATGVPLRAWIEREDRDARDVVRIMRDVAAGLAAAHRAGIIHRDIKPDNVLVGDDRARVVDFGLAYAETSTDDAEAPGAGTPSYMAPEVLAGRPATEASDQFSFAVTLFEALHGERPHAGTTRAELRDAARHAAKASMDQAVPAWVMAIVLRGLAAEPGDRFPSMDALAAELGRDRIRRRRVIAVATIALALGGGAGALVMRTHAGAGPASCSGGDRRALVWSDEQAVRVRERLGDAPWADTAVTSLGRTADRWQASFEHVCAATRVSGAQSDRLLELRMRCLDRVLDRFGALVTAMSGSLDATGRAEAASATGELSDPASCEVLADDAELALPSDPTARAEAIAVERELDRAWAAFALARYTDARTQVGALDARTAKLAAPAQRAAVLVLAGSIESRIGSPASARELLDRALVAAATARANELEYTVWSRLLRHELFAGVPARVIELGVYARAAAARAGHEGADVDAVVAEALRKTGRLADARNLVHRALASKDPVTADQRALLEMNLGSIDLVAGRSADAEAAFRRGLDATRAALGDGHPTLGLYLDKLAHAAVARGRIRDALALHDQSLALRRRAFGDNDRAVATARFYRAQTLIEAGELVRAGEDLDAAYAIRVRQYGDHSPRLGEIVLAMSELAAARGNAVEARAERERAVQLDPRLDHDGPSSDRPPPTAAELLARWRAAGPLDATLSLELGDALVAAGDRASAATVYAAALAALADEPSRTRSRALRALANDSGDLRDARVCRECDLDRVLPRAR